MICTCDAAGIRAVEALRVDAMRRLGLARPEDVTLAVVLSLAFDFAADAEVDADQWFRVYLTTPLKPDVPIEIACDHPADGLIEIDCDHPADGLLYLWTELATQFPERLTASDLGTDADVLAAAVASESRVKAHRSGSVIRNACAAAWGSSVLDATIEQLFPHNAKRAKESP